LLTYRVSLRGKNQIITLPLLAEEHPVVRILCIQLLSKVFLQDYFDSVIFNVVHYNLSYKFAKPNIKLICLLLISHITVRFTCNREAVVR